MKLPQVVVPELFRKTGGVQVFSRRMIEALDEIYGVPVPVISRNDRRADCPDSFLEGRKFRGMGAMPEPLRRFGVITACLASRSRLFITSHPHFSQWLRHQKKWFGSSYLCVAHGIDVWDIAGSKVARGLQEASCVLPVSHYTAARILEQIAEATPDLSVFPNTFDEKRFYPANPRYRWREKLQIPDQASLMLSVCRISKGEEGKGYDEVLEQIPQLLREHAGLTWVLGGVGDDLERIKKKAEELGVAKACRFPGFVPDEHLADLYRSADVFVLPSRKEGFGIVFLEAAACGLPVIAGNRDGSVDALANGELGTLIDPDSSEELRTAVHTALSSARPDFARLHSECVRRFGKKAFRERLQKILQGHPARDERP